MSFKKAERKNAKMRLALSGPAGSGKTYSALLMAKEFGKKIAVMDSERGSASLYVGAPGIPEFDVCELEEKNLQEYREKIREAAEAGYDVLVIDSYSHSWTGALDQIDKMGGWVKGGKVISPLVAKVVDDILSYPGHVIATMRSKAEHVIEKDERTGKATMRKVGMATVARDGTDYEFSVMLDLSLDGGVTVSKTRCSALTGNVYTREDMGKIAATLHKWISEGVALTPRDLLADKIRFAKGDAELAALLPALKELSEEDRAALKPIYVARKAEFQEAE